MKHILVLGAGMVAKPLIGYLLGQSNYEVSVATRTPSKADRIIGGNPKGKSIQWIIEEKTKLDEMVKSSDIVVSLLPWVYHLEVAKVCLANKKPLVTTSYVKPEMKALDKKAKEADVILLNEVGLDPGLDHMGAMKLIDQIKGDGGKVLTFHSYCGALPAPEASYNPIRYKFSWSPRGVLLACNSNARYLERGKIIEIPSEKLFDQPWKLEFPSLGELEAYPNRDSLIYKELYEIEEAKNVLRATLRYPGWCKIFGTLRKLGLLDESTKDFSGLTWRKLLANQIKSKETELKHSVANFLGIGIESEVIKCLQWLGLFSAKVLPLEKGTFLDQLLRAFLEHAKYKEGERDVVLLKHEIIGQYPDNKRKRFVSTLVEFGKIGEETAIARTVGLPAAIATKLIVEGKIKLKGVRIPTQKEIYLPVLSELEKRGIKFEESVEGL